MLMGYTRKKDVWPKKKKEKEKAYLEEDFDSLGGGSDEGGRESTESTGKGKFGYGERLLGSVGAERVHQSLAEVVTLYGFDQSSIPQVVKKM